MTLGRLLDRLGDQVGGTTDGHQVGRLVVLDRFDGDRAAFGFADHAEIRPVLSSIMRVNLSMRVPVVGPAGPTTSSRTGSTGPT
jgi:hypothetical protein